MRVKIHLGYPLYGGLTPRAGNVSIKEHKGIGPGYICVVFTGVYGLMVAPV